MSADFTDTRPVAPYLRSGVLFGDLDAKRRTDYFRAMSEAGGDVVPPEAVFGTNGWARRLGETQADPGTAEAVFAAAWDDQTPEQRLDWMYSNALDRYVGQNLDVNFAEASADADAAAVSELVGGDASRMRDAYAADADYESSNRLLFETVFGKGAATWQ